MTQIPISAATTFIQQQDCTLTLADGRSLGFGIYGHPAGQVVFHFNGSGGSRLERPGDLSILTDLEIKLISTDRPGHGLSDFQSERSLLDWPADIRQLADHLGIQQFCVMGWSAGGPYALACAYGLPERVLAGAVISGPAPMDRPNPYAGQRFLNRSLSVLSRKAPQLVYLLRRITYLAAVRGNPAEAGDKMAAFFPPSDQQMIASPENRELFVADLQEGYRQGWQGPAQDDIVINSSWGFELENIHSRIDLWQGEIDEVVSIHHARYLYEHLPNSRLTIWPGQGHLYLIEHWDEVLAVLVSKRIK